MVDIGVLERACVKKFDRNRLFLIRVTYYLLPTTYYLPPTTSLSSLSLVMNGRCGQPIKSRPGRICTNLASHDVKGVQCCGKHIRSLVRKTTPPPPPPPPSFVPFDCGICMDQCKSASASTKTVCNHRFHKACISKWELRTKHGGHAFTCPMCRKELQRTSTASTSTSVSNDFVQMRNQLELLMEFLRNQNQENTNATLAHLDNLISQGGVDRVASAVNELIMELIDSP